MEGAIALGGGLVISCSIFCTVSFRLIFSFRFEDVLLLVLLVVTSLDEVLSDTEEFTLVLVLLDTAVLSLVEFVVFVLLLVLLTV